MVAVGCQSIARQLKRASYLQALDLLLLFLFIIFVLSRQQLELFRVYVLPWFMGNKALKMYVDYYT